MKSESLRDLSRDELDTRVQELHEQLLKLRFQQSTGQIESPQMLRGVRKDIARALTIRRQRDIDDGAGKQEAAKAPASSEE
ncbi:MAG TPA: 50S ribosomal protein L29 [Acidobacteriota bacterium]|jgi:large subunit ribosomal protein L29